MIPLHLPLHAAPPPGAGRLWRRLAAHLLRSASAALARQARAVERPIPASRRRRGAEADIEFHAEAGAPEGALYIDGALIGHLPVTRL